jgi:hypothetical protein
MRHGVLTYPRATHTGGVATLRAGAQFAREAARERDRERILEELSRGFQNARQAKATARDR